MGTAKQKHGHMHKGKDSGRHAKRGANTVHRTRQICACGDPVSSIPAAARLPLVGTYSSWNGKDERGESGMGRINIGVGHATVRSIRPAKVHRRKGASSLSFRGSSRIMSRLTVNKAFNNKRS